MGKFINLSRVRQNKRLYTLKSECAEAPLAPPFMGGRNPTEIERDVRTFLSLIGQFYHSLAVSGPQNKKMKSEKAAARSATTQ